MIAHDLYESEAVKALGATYVSKEELLQTADVISLHCPLLPSTYHIIDKARCATDLTSWSAIIIPAVNVHAAVPCSPAKKAGLPAF